MKPVEYHPSALEELIQAAEYYESKVVGLGQRFLDEIEQMLEKAIESGRNMISGLSRSCQSGADGGGFLLLPA